MTTITVILVLIVIAGVAIGIYAFVAPRRTDPEFQAPKARALHATTDWTNEAGDEFAGLSESARCDLVFAVAAFDDERSQRLLEAALDDPAESVCLAAAHVLASSGRRPMVEAYLARHPGPRANRLSETLALLD
ncbi:MAG TPA: hypothetical protein VGN11_11350 [Candidatus Baltobacteraceae bacterium]|jgi:hypothetical protein|nr:hypothetical protein [Candidatus Baltobacteraceae bacterium]